MDQHCPDFVLTIQPEHKVAFYVWCYICQNLIDIRNNVLPNKMAKAFPWYILHPHHSCNPQAVVLTILGTRIFPRPHPQVRTSFEKTFDSRFDVLMTDVFDATGSDHGLGGPDKWISWWFCSQVLKLSFPQVFLGFDFQPSGMASGCRSLEREALPTILEQLRIHNGFSLLIVGYSLGAGLAQLFTRYVEQLQWTFMGRI